MRRATWTRALLVGVGIVLWAGSSLAETVDKIVANVNGEIILYSELKTRVGRMAQINPAMKSGDAGQQAQTEREVLRLMILERLAEQEMKRLKITVAPKDVDAAIDGIKRENRVSDAQFEQALKQQGQTVEQFREVIKKQLERSRLLERAVKSKILVSDADVDAFFKSGPGALREKRRIAVIFLPIPEDKPDKAPGVEKQAVSIHARLKAGEDFGRLAREYSKGPGADQGGDIGYVDSNELARPMEAATRNLGKDEISEVVQTPAGFYILKKLDSQKEPLDSTDPSVRDKVRRFLVNQETEQKYSE